jgi:O-antigen/teichoic acid export membrane protein
MAGNFGLRVIISRLVGAEGLGLYFLAAQIAFLPSELASEVVGTVAFPLFARLQSDIQKVKRAFQAILTGLMALLYPVCALIIVLSPVLVQEILGSKWEGTVSMIQILAFVTMMGLLADGTVPLLKGLGKPHWFTQINLVQSSTLIVMIWYFCSQFGVIGAALAWLPTTIFVLLLCLSFIRRTFNDPFQGIIKPLLVIFIATLTGAGISYMAIHLLPNIPGLVIAGLLAVLVTGAILWFSDRRYSLGLVRNVAIAFPQIASILRIKDMDIN